MTADLTPFACSYRHSGETWCLTIHAADWSDAVARLRAIGVRGQVDGVSVATIPLPQPRRWWERLIARGADR